MTGRLTLCATPIGNLGDIPARLADAVASADLVYAEDTRRTRTLLEHLGVRAEIRSYFVGNEEARAEELAERLRAGAGVVLVTDAGTPGIADPGLTAVRAALSAGAEVSVVPGPSAVTAALAISGMPADRFVFEGFLPRKAGARAARLESLAGERRTLVFFSARSRVAADLDAMATALGRDRPVVVARELTKAHEQIMRGSLGEAADHWRAEEARGEFTVVVHGAQHRPVPVSDLVGLVAEAVGSGASLSDAVRDIAETYRVSRRDLYEASLRARDGA